MSGCNYDYVVPCYRRLNVYLVYSVGWMRSLWYDQPRHATAGVQLIIGGAPHWRRSIPYHIIYHTIPYHTILCHTIPYNIPYHIIYHIPYHTMYHTIPYNIPYHTIPYNMPYHTIPYHTMPYHTISYHTIPYHTIPYHTIPLKQTHAQKTENISKCDKAIKQYKRWPWPRYTTVSSFNSIKSYRNMASRR